MYRTPFIFLYLLFKLVAANNPLHPLSDDFIDLINKEGKWKAGRNFHPDTSMAYIKTLLGVNLGHLNTINLPNIKHDKELIKSLPESFDSRYKWPNCSSLNEIRDQGRCGSCWALSSTSAMTDRVCVYSNGTKNFHFSAEDLATCDGFGCYGGDPYQAWQYWVIVGLVSGGNYGSQQGCRPYSIAPCAHHMGNCTHYSSTPPCVQSCADGYNVSYEEDKRHGKTAYALQGMDDIMAELYKNGPLVVSFKVYEDLANYKSGVYQHIYGKQLGGHAVKVMGWGVEDGKKYWLIANSWGKGFGEDGYFKILRGVNECHIEHNAVGGEPLLENL